MTLCPDLVLAQRQRLAGGDADLPFDEIEPGHRLGHRMLDLQPRIHLNEIKAFFRRHEFDGAGAGIVDRPRRGDPRLSHRPPPRRVEPGRRRLFNHLLMAALDRTVALEQVDRVAVPVGEDLDFDVPRPCQIFLDQQPIVAEGGGRFPPGTVERCDKIGAAADNPHAAPAAARRGLDQHRKADPFGLGQKPRGILFGAVIARHHRHPVPGHQGLGRGLQTPSGEAPRRAVR